MITPLEIKTKALKLWKSQQPLRLYLRGETLFPKDIPFKNPSAKQLAQEFARVKQWIHGLRQSSKEQQGFGYTVTFKEVNTRQVGIQWLPQRICFDSLEDFCRYIGKQGELQRFQIRAGEIAARYSALIPWLIQKPLQVLQYDALWPQLLAVLHYFENHPKPGCYLRELDIPQVDSKFIERHKGLLRELLDQILPPKAFDDSIKGLAEHGFERRYGLNYDPPLIRFRLLDHRCLFHAKLADLSIPLHDFQMLDPDCENVFITENKINGLSFLSLPGGMVIFGLGYGISALKGIRWLRDKKIFYWGDIDTHGFAILSQLRGYYPQTRSLLMERQTLLHFRSLWVSEPEDKRTDRELPQLTESEKGVYDLLRNDTLGKQVRLEQERIRFSYARKYILASVASQPLS
ncbi:MAG: hypothetical protein GY862_38645 [Gammaproteobacteria bacterium]|nr:hypothetical protein [Gammaproteobacteria bacterium]